ncbi:MAG: hypothetical protein LBS52_03020 [Dysgonamonadaceae bacterium]|jgi:hypothetical protein|nr:hypothetical protein [Dysgonamonadaceae bacterium]
MKRKPVFSRILPLLVFTTAFHHASLHGQTTEGKPPISFSSIAKTSDVLYTNDSTYFLMDKSPLEQFPGYKKLYEDKLEPYGVISTSHYWLICPDPASNYMVDWYLQGNLLYMSDILPNAPSDKIEKIFPGDELYKRMEKLTGVKFEKVYEDRTSYTYKEYKYNPPTGQNRPAPPGAMPAIWFSGTIIVKRAAKSEDATVKWMREPCRELIFKDGKLISNRVKEGMS